MGSKGGIKVVIMVGGPQKGTRFRPLSLEVPKPLFPVAGVPIVQHHIEACKKIKGLSEIIILGYYQNNEQISRFIDDMQREHRIAIRYLQEYKPLGTAGGLYHFRDQIVGGGIEAVVVLHSDVFCRFPLENMLEKYREKNIDNQEGCHMLLATKASPTQTMYHGNIVADFETMEVRHYVEKPETYVSDIINGGAYIFHPSIFKTLGEAFQEKFQAISDDAEFQSLGAEFMMLEKDLLTGLAGNRRLYFYLLQNRFWGSMKSAGSAIYANRQYLSSYNECNPERLAKNGSGQPEILGDVFIHPTAKVHPTAKIGPNVTVGSNCVIGEGARIRQSIILDGAELREHCCVLYSIIGWRCVVGPWARVEGAPHEPSPDFPHALISNESLFQIDGKLIPSISILGCNVVIPREVIILNSIVLPHKELNGSYKNQIIL